MVFTVHSVPFFDSLSLLPSAPFPATAGTYFQLKETVLLNPQYAACPAPKEKEKVRLVNVVKDFAPEQKTDYYIHQVARNRTSN